MRIAQTVQLTGDDIKEAIQEWAKKKKELRKKELGPIELHVADMANVAEFELHDKPETGAGDTAEA